MTKPVISVIMPAFNAAMYLEQAVNSVINQTYSNWELIVINDGSTDNTKNIAEQFVNADARIQLINQTNKKLSGARNAGIQKALGEWIAFLDADDIWVKDKLERQVQIAKQYPDAGLIYTDGYIFTNNNITNTQPYGTVTGLLSGKQIYKLQYQGNHIPVLSVIVKKNCLNNVGLQDENLRVCQDWDYWLRLAVNNVTFYGMPEKLFYYRRHATNISGDTQLIAYETACVFIKNYRKELLPKEQFTKTVQFVNLTINSLLAADKISEALTLNTGINDILKHRLRELGNYFMTIMGHRSYYLMRLIFKADQLLMK